MNFFILILLDFVGCPNLGKTCFSKKRIPEKRTSKTLITYSANISQLKPNAQFQPTCDVCLFWM